MDANTFWKIFGYVWLAFVVILFFGALAGWWKIPHSVSPWYD